ncbi:MAG: helix-turn-helix transcriptional regulator [Oscillospiraceae bacterium]|nr:helix-turn-helix transcriptional regulator [Oscillospiraceae bacterium]
MKGSLHRISKCRGELGYSQKQLAQKLGVSRSTVGMWETGRSSPNPFELKELSKVLNVSVDYILEIDSLSELPKEKPALGEILTKDESRLLTAFRAVNLEKIRIAMLEIFEDYADANVFRMATDSKKRRSTDEDICT